MLNNLKFLLITSAVLSIVLFSCTDDIGSLDNSNQDSMGIIPFVEIKAAVETELSEGEIFYWEKQSSQLIFSAAMHSDSFIAIGYSSGPDFIAQRDMHIVNLTNSKWIKAKNTIEELILLYEQKNYSETITMRDLLPYGDVANFPQIIIKITSIELIEELRNHELVRFVEPIGFSITDQVSAERSDSGCDGAPNYSINPADYTTIDPTIKLPWNFVNHNVDQAWTNSSKGDNVKVCIIDTGASFDQDNLGSNFNSGNSSGRTVEKYSTKYSGKWWWKTLDSPDDPCGHGTSMAGGAAAPRSNDGNAVGVAYQSNLMTIRGVEDVIISTSNERNGVRDALFLAGNSDVKIISMSIGTPFYSSTVADGVYFAYNKGKLMFAAAGTSLSWTSWYPVIFPATMSQTRAVTGVKDSPNLVKCATCHSGSQVDFVIIMERQQDNDRHSLSLARYSDQPKYVGGSSIATSNAAGIATMVWGQNVNASRAQVLQALKNASSIYPGRSNNFGWGLIDANIAVGNLD